MDQTPQSSTLHRLRNVLEMSNRTTPAERNSDVEWKTPSKGGYPENSPRSHAMKWLKSEEALLTVMRSSTQGDLLASISLMLEQKDELLSIIERFPTLTSSGPAAVREKASVVDYIDDEMEQKIAYRVDLGERSHEQAFKLVSYLIVGNTKLWRLIRLYFVYVVLSDEATVLMQDPDDATRFIKMDFGSVALEQTNAFADSISDDENFWIIYRSPEVFLDFPQARKNSMKISSKNYCCGQNIQNLQTSANIAKVFVRY